MTTTVDLRPDTVNLDGYAGDTLSLRVTVADSFGGTFNVSGYGTSTEETCDVEVAEVILYNRKLSDVDRAAVEGYLSAKWGL